MMCHLTKSEGWCLMSHFSKTLNCFMQKRELRSVDICNKLSINKSRFSKIKNGALLPTDFELVNQLAKVLQLSHKECEAFYLSYQMSKFGSDFEWTEAAMQRIYAVKLPERCADTEWKVFAIDVENGHLFLDKVSVLSAVRWLCMSSGKINLFFQPEEADLCETIARCAASRRDVVIQWLLCLENSNATASPKNLDVFSRALPILISGKIEARYVQHNITELDWNQMFPYQLITDRGVLLITKDCTRALWLSECHAVEMYAEKFQANFQGGGKFCTVSPDIATFLSMFVNLSEKPDDPVSEDLYVLKKHPCIAGGATMRDFQKILLEDEDNDGYLANMCYSFFIEYLTRAKREHVIFSNEGLQEFFQMDLFYEYSESISKPISKEKRCAMIQHILENAKEHMGYQMLQYSFMDHTAIHGVNIWSEGTVLMMLNYHEQFMIVSLKEKGIALAIIAYLEYLEQLKILYSKENTMQVLKEYLERYAVKPPESDAEETLQQAAYGNA